MEPAAIVEEVKKSNLRGLGGAGVPHRRQVGLHPQGLDTRPEVSRDQRGRGGARAPSRTAICSSGSPRADRGHDHRGARHRLAPRVRLHPRGVRASVARVPEQGSARGLRRRTPSARTSRSPGSISTSSCTAAPVPTSAARRRASSVLARGQEGLAQDQAAVPRRERGHAEKPKVIGHTGGFPGISSVLWIDLDEGYTLAALANMDGGSMAIQENVRKLLSHGKE